MRLASPEVAHVLISGTTGSGKTALCQTMILSLAMSIGAANCSLCW
jgi:DNA segregation ATPase FtsK/SpoIIIE-like protein